MFLILGGKDTTNATQRYLDILLDMNSENEEWKKIKTEFANQRYANTKSDDSGEVGLPGNGLSFLHLAALYLPKGDATVAAAITRQLIRVNPSVLTGAHSEPGGYDHVTPLHIAVHNGNAAVVCQMLHTYNETKTMNSTNVLLECVVTSPSLSGTALGGQLPLSVAALTFNKEMVDLLISQGATVFACNSSGDSVFHSLVKYAARWPEKTDAILDMMSHIIHLLNAACEEKTPDPNLYASVKSTEENPKPSTSANVEGASTLRSNDTVVGDREHPGDTVTKGATSDCSSSSSSSSRFSDRAISAIKKLYHSQDETFVKAALLMENGKGETTLTLAARLGLKNVFEFVINLPGNVYRTDTPLDDVLHTKFYDITEIDKHALTTSLFFRHVLAPPGDNTGRKSVLDYIGELPLQKAIEMTGSPVLKQVAIDKWFRYRKFYFGLAVFHFAAMCVITAATAVRGSPEGQQYVSGVNIISFILPLPYLIMEFVRFKISGQQFPLYHNGPIRVRFVMFAIILLIHACWDRASPWDSYLAPPTLVLGWWTMTFFLRGFEKFGYFTVLLPTIVVGDFVRFFVFLFTSVVAFSAAIMTAIPSSVGEFSNYGMTILTMIKLAVAPQDVSDHSANAERPALAVILLCLYLVLTYVILVHCLIAMIVVTCSRMTIDVKGHTRLQRLSVAIFIEGTLPPRWKSPLKKWVKQRRLHCDADGLKHITEKRFPIKVYMEE